MARFVYLHFVQAAAERVPCKVRNLSHWVVGQTKAGRASVSEIYNRPYCLARSRVFPIENTNNSKLRKLNRFPLLEQPGYDQIFEFGKVAIPSYTIMLFSCSPSER